MNKLLIVFFMITNVINGQTIKRDKLLHMGGSYFMSSSVSSLVYDKTKDKKKSLIIGFTASMVLGMAKEIYDIKYGKPDIKDVIANTVGSSLGIITIRITL